MWGGGGGRRGKSTLSGLVFTFVVILEVFSLVVMPSFQGRRGSRIEWKRRDVMSIKSIKQCSKICLPSPCGAVFITTGFSNQGNCLVDTLFCSWGQIMSSDMLVPKQGREDRCRSLLLCTSSEAK